MKVKNNVNIIFVFLALFVISCDKKKNSNDIEIRTRYFNLENQGWKSKNIIQNIEGTLFSATEVPIQYYLLKNKGTVNLKEVDSIYEKNKFERIIEFQFQDEEEKNLLEGKDKKTQIVDEDLVKYLSFDIQKDFVVVNQKRDTIPCSGVLYERTYKITPYNKILLFFSGINPNDRIQLIYKDNLFLKGNIKFQFKENYTPIAL
ncbi:hypothetical protein [Flavobacterium oreochromis]|uniref:Lipoprotein n=1 Tax=Flavobacterium oreochromis TaxID=2906078 RepID=A0ABW8P564_9FLAO|nr:hypothetical protein [Flavobacterium oreochromis]OWP78968.1 hypothetical protein BWG23_00015 [Flavobacterium oreochromis]POR30742.1 hypothetical protein BWK58_00115 [Flavobacterium columnare]QYS87113.1 hypothetical protein JJC03_03875 [Flavobacterium oreochromis]